MSEFNVPVVRIAAIEPISNADAIELAVVGDYRSVVRKGEHRTGDLAAYIPEGAVVPQWLLERMGLWDAEKGKGRLAGNDGCRVKAIKLRGCLSQGLLYGTDAWGDGTNSVQTETGWTYVAEGGCVASLLGITKYEPPIPAHMAGEVCNIYGHTLGYDIENLKAYPEVLQPGEPVAVTEKIHGTCCQIGIIPGLGHDELFFGGDVFAASKGLGSKGLVFKNNDANAENLYVRALWALESSIELIRREQTDSVYIFGEVFGFGVQDLQYGLKTQKFRAFDVYLGKPGQGRWLGFDEKSAFLSHFDIPMVPVVYVGPYSREKVAELRDGKTVAGGGAHIREGVVVTPIEERRDDRLGRVILKDVSETYLLRKGNATEFN